MQYSQEHLKTMVYAEFGGQTECIMGNWKIENANVVNKTRTTKSRQHNSIIQNAHTVKRKRNIELRQHNSRMGNAEFKYRKRNKEHGIEAT